MRAIPKSIRLFPFSDKQMADVRKKFPVPVSESTLVGILLHHASTLDVDQFDQMQKDFETEKRRQEALEKDAPKKSQPA